MTLIESSGSGGQYGYYTAVNDSSDEDAAEPSRHSLDGFYVRMDAATATGYEDECRDIMEEISTAGLSPDINIYTSYMNLLVQNENAQDASAVWNDMQTHGVQPNWRICSTLLPLFLREKYLEGAFTIFKEMRKQCMPLDVLQGSSLTQQLMQIGNIQKAIEVNKYISLGLTTARELRRS